MCVVVAVWGRCVLGWWTAAEQKVIRSANVPPGKAAACQPEWQQRRPGCCKCELLQRWWFVLRHIPCAFNGCAVLDSWNARFSHIYQAQPTHTGRAESTGDGRRSLLRHLPKHDLCSDG